MPMTSLGIVVDAGSRQSFATHGAVGVAHLAELMAFKSTLRRDHAGVLAAVEQMGGMVNANSSREQMLYVVDALRENVEEAVALLAETVLVPSFAADEIDEGREVLAFLYDEMQQDQLVKELLQAAAYGARSPLGGPLCYDLRSLDDDPSSSAPRLAPAARRAARLIPLRRTPLPPPASSCPTTAPARAALGRNWSRRCPHTSC